VKADGERRAKEALQERNTVS